jgi:hypothetical protein
MTLVGALKTMASVTKNPDLAAQVKFSLTDFTTGRDTFSANKADIVYNQAAPHAAALRRRGRRHSEAAHGDRRLPGLAARSARRDQYLVGGHRPTGTCLRPRRLNTQHSLGQLGQRLAQQAAHLRQRLRKGPPNHRQPGPRPGRSASAECLARLPKQCSGWAQAHRPERRHDAPEGSRPTATGNWALL